MRLGAVLVSALLVLALLSGLLGPRSRVVRVGGSTALLPLMAAAARIYGSRHPDVRIEVIGGGSLFGLEQLRRGALDLAMTDVRPAAARSRALPWVRVPLLLVSSCGLGVKDVALAALRRMFAGQITDWHQIGGPQRRILLVLRPDSSGSMQRLRQLLGPVRAKARVALNSTGQVADVLLQHPGAIGFLEPPYLRPGHCVLSLSGVAPSAPNLRRGRYALSFVGYLAPARQLSGDLRGLLRYLRSPDFYCGQAALLGYLRVDGGPC